ncbi:hypothetical protein GCM10012275_20270 [Longimycelium tulufanense]|uniref:SCP domain-containing protein n=1 Tax=Longimycelium tulufanense TaxID=907463 RepID=A0A8J3C7L8_9PSEU|nr:CAP domain-containing protein [Longimycelium tulufanense]GGM49345.1 hypothetical protein GCM10012275_20270 [Longimycelium tulufanense]
MRKIAGASAVVGCVGALLLAVTVPALAGPSPAAPGAGAVASARPLADPAAVERKVIDLTNQQRKRNGCKALRANAALGRAARKHSTDMAAKNYFSHTSRNGRTFTQRIRAEGYRYQRAAENIAAGYGTPEKVVAGWMKSSGHRANILNCALTEVGVGFAENPRGSFRVYWTQNFGTPAR